MPAGTFRQQGEKYTNLIKRVIRDYNCNSVGETGFIAVQEYLANAEDCGATEFSIIWDQRHCGSRNLISDRLAKWQGPALCFFNDSTFSEEDWENFDQIGESLKKDQKIGQFGLGHLTGYFITDVIQILSGQDLAITDPHTKHISENQSLQDTLFLTHLTENGKGDVHWNDQLEPFASLEQHIERNAAGSIERLSGTMFRLPLRTKELGAQSLISDGSWVCPEEIEKLMGTVDSMAMDLLMFTKNVKKLTAYIVAEDGVVTMKTHLEKTKNELPESEFFKGKSHLQLQVYNVECSRMLCIPKQALSALNQERSSVKQSSFLVLSSPQENNHLVPSVEVAACMEQQYSDGSKVKYPSLQPNGLLYYVMPMTFRDTYLPIHINARFKIQSDRRSLLSDVQDGGKTDYNRELAKSKIGPMWSLLVSFMCQREQKDQASCKADQVTLVESLWPPSNFAQLNPRPLDLSAEAFIEEIFQKQLPIFFTRASGGKLLSSSEAVFLPAQETVPKEVVEACVLHDVPIVKPPSRVYEHLESHLKHASVKLMGPELMRNALRGKDIDAQYVDHALEYGLSDKNYESMVGLKLVPLASGQLATFKKRNAGNNNYFILDTNMRDVPNLVNKNTMEFVRSSKSKVFSKQLCKTLNIGLPTPLDVVRNLKQFRLPDDTELICQLWKLLKHWQSQGQQWRTQFINQAIVPVSSGQLLSIEACEALGALSPAALKFLGNDIEPVLKAFKCTFIGTCGLNEEAPWDFAFDQNGVEMRGQVGSLVLNSIKNYTMSGEECTQLKKSHPKGFSRFLECISNQQFEKLRMLPVFENLQGTMVCLKGQMAATIPGAYDQFLFHGFITPKHKFVSRKTASKVHNRENLNYLIPAETPLSSFSNLVHFFVYNIVPGSGGKVVWNAAFRVLSKCSDEALAPLMKLPIVMNTSTGEFHIASAFIAGRMAEYLGNVQTHTFMVLDEKAFDAASVEFLKRIGLHTELDDATLPECVRQISSILYSHGGEVVCCILRTAIGKIMASNHLGSPLMELLKGPVFPTSCLSQYTMGGHYNYPLKLLRLGKGVEYRDRNLVFSSCPVLHESLGDLQDLRRKLEFRSPIDLRHVLQHLVNIAKPGGLYSTWKVNGYALRDIEQAHDAVWDHLERNCKSNSDTDVIASALRGVPCVLIPRLRTFVEASQLSYDVVECTGAAPFPVPENFKRPDRIRILRRLGASQFVWSFLEKLGCPSSSGSNDTSLNSLDASSMVRLMLEKVGKVAPSPQSKINLFETIRRTDPSCWQLFRDFVGRNCLCQQASQLVQLPIFRTLQETYVAPAEKTVCVPPTEFAEKPVPQLLWANDVTILEDSTDCDKNLNRHISELSRSCSCAGFFQIIILPALGKPDNGVPLPEKVALVKKFLSSLANTDFAALCSWVRNHRILLDPGTGNLRYASDYVSTANPLFHFLAGQYMSTASIAPVIELLPEDYRAADIRELLSYAGLHKTINDNLFPRCVQQLTYLDSSHMTKNLGHVIQILKYPNRDIIPDETKQLLRQHRLFPLHHAEGPQSWGLLSETADYEHRELVSPFKQVLHQDLGSMLALRRVLGLHDSPRLDMVIENLVRVGAADEAGTLLNTPSSGTFQTPCSGAKVWEFILRQPVAPAVQQALILQQHPCVQLSCGRFVRPELSYDQSVDTGQPPYPVPNYLRKQYHHPLLKMLDITGDPLHMPEEIVQTGKPATDILIQNLSAAFNNQEDSDVILSVSDQRIYGHKIILRMASSYFARSFSGRWELLTSEDGQDMVCFDGFPGASYESLSTFMQYLYTGKVLKLDGTDLASDPNDGNLLLELLQLSECFGDQYVKTFCEKRIVAARFVSPQNCCQILHLADNFRAEQLEKVCKQIIRGNVHNRAFDKSALKRLPKSLQDDLEI